MEKLVLERVPPGDNWKCVDEDKSFMNLTLALGHIFKKTKIKEFHISADEGKVWIITTEKERLPDVDDLYGD